MINYYKALGVSISSTSDEIKKAFRNLSKQYHPDLNPDNETAEEHFKKIQEAYFILKNAEKRKDYDFKLNQYKYRKQLIKRKFRSSYKTTVYPKNNSVQNNKKQFKLTRANRIGITFGIVFLIVLAFMINYIEKKFDNIEAVDTTEATIEIITVDSLNLIEGYKSDTVFSQK